MHEQVKLLIENKSMPVNLVPIELTQTISKAEFDSWSYEKKMENKDSVIIVCEDAVWAYADEVDSSGNIRPGTTIYSGDGTIVAKHMRRVKFARFTPTHLGLNVMSGGVESLYIKNNKSKEDSQMEGINLNVSEEELQKLGETAPNNSMESTGFVGEQKSEKTNAPTVDPGVQKIRELTSHVKVSQFSKLDQYNRKNSKLIGYVTAGDRRVQMVTSIVVTSYDNLLPEADEKARALHNAGQKTKVSPSNYPHKYEIGWKETRPGKIVSAIIERPREGIIDYHEMRNASGPIQFESESTTLVKQNLRYEDFVAVLTLYYPEGIKEDERTHREKAGDVRVMARVKTSTDDNSVEERRYLASSTRKTALITPHNYFPINTYDTVDLSKESLDEAELEGLHLSAFYTMMKPRNGNANKFKSLTDKSLELFEVADEQSPGKSRTTVFAQGLTNRRIPQVSSFHDKDTKLAIVEFPIKKLIPAEGEKAERVTFVKIDTLNEEVIKNKDPRASLFSPKFKAIRDIIGEELLDPKALREFTRRTGGSSGSAKNLLSSDDLRRLSLSGSYGNGSVKTNISALADFESLASRVKPPLEA